MLLGKPQADAFPITKASAWLGQCLSPILANAIGQASDKFRLGCEWKHYLEIKNLNEEFHETWLQTGSNHL